MRDFLRRRIAKLRSLKCVTAASGCVVSAQELVAVEVEVEVDEVEAEWRGKSKVEMHCSTGEREVFVASIRISCSRKRVSVW